MLDSFTAFMSRSWSRAAVAGVVFGIVLSVSGNAGGQYVKIVGIGASGCATFNHDTAQDLMTERNYLAWAQGFMSATLLSAPRGKDEGLDLTPETFRLQRQADFLREFCRQNPDLSYSEGVITLYRALRAVAGEH